MSAADEDLVGWLLEGDPAIRWRVLRDLTGAGEREVAREQERVATEGWGARLLARQNDDGHDFFLRHRLYKSHRTGEVAIPASVRFPAFPEWHFDVLRGLEHFARCGAERDARLGAAVEVIRKARRPDGRWPGYAGYPGRQFFRLEEPGASRWNTSRALRVLRWWQVSAG